MLLAHAKALATSEVERGGVKFPKDGQFTDEQLSAEDWEPVRAEWVPPTPPEDCGCGPVLAANVANEPFDPPIETPVTEIALTPTKRKQA